MHAPPLPGGPGDTEPGRAPPAARPAPAFHAGASPSSWGRAGRDEPGWYGRGLLVLTVAILLLSAADAALTLSLLTAGVVEEMNPLMRALINYDTRVFALVKILVTALCLLGLLALMGRSNRVQRTVRRALHGLLVVYGMVVVYELLLRTLA